MAYRTIILFLFSTLFQNYCRAEGDTLIMFKELQKRVDSIVKVAIDHHAFPGCVIYASRRGEPFFFKAYGHHTYDSLQEVKNEDLYDLASVTKVIAATLALMKLYDDKLIDLDAKVQEYVRGLRWSKLGRATLRECLAHQAGLKSWIKYYEEIQRSSGKYRHRTISNRQSEKYPYVVAEGLYLHKDFYRKIKRMIKRAEVKEEQGYVYSGLFFYLVPELVCNITGIGFSEYLNKHFYDSLNAETVTFNPHEKFFKYQIVPTEIDSFFRREPIHGRVHDEGAILMRGVSGNAGLFGNAEDIASIWHMLLNGGTYKGKQYLRPQTIHLFTTYQYPNNGNRRALGFDKPLLEYDSILSSVAKSVSLYSYGHTGYTGTLVWADPKSDFLFVFLSNRVYPSRSNRAIYQMNVRPEIHQALYDYLEQLEAAELIRTMAD